MASEFNPYHVWLSIQPTESVDHYRLLGLQRFEGNPDVIENAAEQRMRHVRTFQTGKYSEQSQAILNELSAARLCLLDSAKRLAYDDTLRTRPTPVVAHAAPATDLAQPSLATLGIPHPWIVGAVIVGMGVSVAVGMWLAGSAPPPVVAQNSPREPLDGAKETLPELNIKARPPTPTPEPVAPVPTPLVQPLPVAVEKPMPMIPVVPAPESTPDPKPSPQPEPERAPDPKPELKPTEVPPANKLRALRDMPSSVSLPPSAMAATRVVLGKAHVSTDDPATIRLLGAERASGSGEEMTYRLVVGTSGPVTREWEVRAGRSSVNATLIAMLSLQDGELAFEWTREGAVSPASPFLQNCVLHLRMGGEERYLALRQPITAPALVLQLDKPTIKADFKLAFLPRASALSLQILPISATGVPRHRIEPAISALEKGKVDILFGEEDQELLKLHIDSVVGERVTVTVAPYFKLTQTGFVKMTAKQLTDGTSQVIQMNLALQVQLDQIKRIPRDQVPEGQRQAFDVRKRQLEEQVTINHATVARLEAIQPLREALNAKGALHFRILYEVDDGQTIVLAESTSAPEARNGVPVIRFGPEQEAPEPKAPTKKKPTPPKK